jgi:hypothetical protein
LCIPCIIQSVQCLGCALGYRDTANKEKSCEGVWGSVVTSPRILFPEKNVKLSLYMLGRCIGIWRCSPALSIHGKEVKFPCVRRKGGCAPHILLSEESKCAMKFGVGKTYFVNGPKRCYVDAVNETSCDILKLKNALVKSVYCVTECTVCRLVYL